MSNIKLTKVKIHWANLDEHFLYTLVQLFCVTYHRMTSEQKKSFNGRKIYSFYRNGRSAYIRISKYAKHIDFNRDFDESQKDYAYYKALNIVNRVLNIQEV